MKTHSKSARQRDLITRLLDCAGAIRFILWPGRWKGMPSARLMTERTSSTEAERRVNRALVAKLRRSDRAIVSLMQLESARAISRELRQLWFDYRVLTWPLWGVVLWRLFILKETQFNVWQRIIRFDVFGF